MSERVLKVLESGGSRRPRPRGEDSREPAGEDKGEGLSQALGRRLRALRVATGRSLREQARLLQISASALSELENGRGGVSLQSLQRLSEAYGVHISDLLAATTAPEPADSAPEVVRRWSASEMGIMRGKGAYYQLLNAPTGNGNGASAEPHQIQPYLISLGPGGGYKEDQIGHAGEEFAFVITGEVELLIGDEVITLAQGDAVRFASSAAHAFRNGSATGVALVVGAATPPW